MIYAIDPGPVNCGLVIGTSDGKINTKTVIEADQLLQMLHTKLSIYDTVVMESVTPRPNAFPGMWSQTLRVAEVIGAVKWICKQKNIHVVMQNPARVVRDKTDKRHANPHISDAIKHYEHYRSL